MSLQFSTIICHYNLSLSSVIAIFYYHLSLQSAMIICHYELSLSSVIMSYYYGITLFQFFSISTHQSDRQLIQPPLLFPEPRYSNHPVTIATQYQNTTMEEQTEPIQFIDQPDQYYNQSPNIDSAFDNNSPSASSSEQGSYVIGGTSNLNDIHISVDHSFVNRSNIELDVDAMEEEALAKSGAGTPRSLINDGERRVQCGGDDVPRDITSNMPSVHVGLDSEVINQEQLLHRNNCRIGYTEIVHNSLERNGKARSRDSWFDNRSVVSEPRQRCGDDFTRDLCRRLSYHQHHHNQHIQPPQHHQRNQPGWSSCHSREMPPMTNGSSNLHDSGYIPEGLTRSSPDASVTYPGFTSGIVTHYPQSHAKCKPTTLVEPTRKFHSDITSTHITKPRVNPYVTKWTQNQNLNTSSLPKCQFVKDIPASDI